ncbi:hypothetical protein SAMN05444392_11623 [Seinonella peptonophila]|uniref:Uncharacterized protein n=1 Tax=Seinonella peptonophila TaxID=112248 RepID=A0A1M5AVB4_9BACL|nr:hypothetical protein [Seinonella peptonophila]SHF34153.1 hypothetical protein SAMN05444392_11623 [Seinonella peptonophila]
MLILEKRKPNKRKRLVIIDIKDWNGEDADYIKVGDELKTFDQMLIELS